MMQSRARVFSRFSLFGALIVLTALASLFTRAQAQTPAAVSDDDINRIANQLYCPVCENIPLDVCPTEACSRWRDAIRQKLELGWSDEAIIDNFVEAYGARVIGTPPKAGLNWLLYVIPPFAAIGLGAAAFMILRKNRVAKSDPEVPAAEVKRPVEPYRKKLNDDINQDK
jgi:cytochrome c-type biogenesis protein CcmH